MSGDDLKKVRPGDTFDIPASAYNAFIDAAQALRERGTIFGGGAVGERRQSCTTMAYNRSGGNAPIGAVVQLTERQKTQKQIEFVQPDENGQIYGIALGPITNERMGLIAVGGGSWKIKSSAGSPGMCLTPVPNSWTAEEGTGPWRAIDHVTDGLCDVVFAVGGAILAARAAQGMMYDDYLYNVNVIGTDGSTLKTVQAVRFPGYNVQATTPGVIVSAGGVSMFIATNSIEVRPSNPGAGTLYPGRVWIKG